jgi:CRP/FNR family cyclic AMP-dependent transcriptional regulator
LHLLYFSADTTLAVDGNWYFLKHNYTQHELGTILGVSRVTISKFVNEFCKDGIIRVVNRRMQINIRHYNSLDRQLAVR